MKASVFFSPSDERKQAATQEEGARGLRTCSVQLDCQSFAETSQQRYGVWEV
ncbi:WhiB family transcriptional regulator [Streptomyces sp. KL116D]|uniref:WhiB family transcriptional regulator n=1 Tax=Streptomyces sp. KL116D TaxID=3045152 RepID=UPI003555F792